ncbi:MAG: hypothetical protein JSS34_04245 [Proteobacteria bacterium]|nr:hypothetical protein [Pseudomonadota bacterium]
MKNIPTLILYVFIIFSPSFVLSMAQEERESKPVLHVATTLLEESILISREGFTTTKKPHKGHNYFFLTPQTPDISLSEEITFNLHSIRNSLLQRVSSQDPFSSSPLHIPCLFIDKETQAETALDIPFHTISSVEFINLPQEDSFQKNTTLTIQLLGGFTPGREPQLILEFMLLCSHFSKDVNPPLPQISELHFKSYHLLPKEEPVSIGKPPLIPSKSQLSDPFLVFYDASTGFLFRTSSSLPSSYFERKPLCSRSSPVEMVSFGEILRPSPRYSGYYKILASDPSPSCYVFKHDTNFFIAYKNGFSLSPLEDEEIIFLTNLLSPSNSEIIVTDPLLLNLGNGYYEFHLKGHPFLKPSVSSSLSLKCASPVVACFALFLSVS